jgi:uncharacterized protein YndB with AHSA1/START domain
MSDLEPLVGQFGIERRFFYDREVQRVWRALTAEMGLWWSERVHDEARTSIEAIPGGLWTQTWSTGGALLGTVTHVQVPVLLRMSGSLASNTPVLNTVELVLEPTTERGTNLYLSHRAFGQIGSGDESAYVDVWDSLLDHSLREFFYR